jgi:hypothetical protein
MKPQDIIGPWNLLAMEATSQDGAVMHPFGESPTGMILYDPSGYMFYIAMRSDRGNFESGDVLGGTPEEKVAAFESFDAYNGTYEVNIDDQIITHTVEASRTPNWKGTKQVRHFRLSGNKLIIETPPILAQASRWVIQVIFERPDSS